MPSRLKSRLPSPSKRPSMKLPLKLLWLNKRLL